MTQEDEILALQKELSQNPKSPQFARLADLYLSRDMREEAENLTKQSLKFHPRSVSGLILLGRIFKLKKSFSEAVPPLTEATKLAPENWRAWLELGESYLEMNKGKPALNAFKKVLFFNPTHPLARRAIAKLELLTADEYEEDLFQLKKLPESVSETVANPSPARSWTKPDDALIRMISFIDALILRHENDKALTLLNECTVKYGSHPEIESRKLKLSVFEKPSYIQPKSAANASLARQKLINQKKISALEMLLRRIELKKSEMLSSKL